MNITLLIYLLIFTYGITIGSFLNVCIYRIPEKESLFKRSHCKTCEKKIIWCDLIPILSYILLKGKCRNCKSKISLQYPFIELMNGILYILVFITNGFTYTSIIYCLCTSALIVLSLIDLRTFEIPERINIFILILAIIKLLIYKQNIKEYIIGFFIVSILLLIIYLLTKGKGVGGGDVKLMAATGLLIGYKSIILAFVLGCILGSIIHLARMKLTNQENILAFGPYLSIGIYITMLYGNQLVNWYLTLILT